MAPIFSFFVTDDFFSQTADYTYFSNSDCSRSADNKNFERSQSGNFNSNSHLPTKTKEALSV